MTRIERLEPVPVVVVSVTATGTDGREYDARINVRPGLLEGDPRNLDAVYGMLESNLEARMREKGAWSDAGEADDQ